MLQASIIAAGLIANNSILTFMLQYGRPRGFPDTQHGEVEFDHNAYRSIDEFFNEAWLQAQTFVLMSYTTNLI